MKTTPELYTFTLEFQDDNGNELKRQNIEAFDLNEANEIAKKMLAECMINDCVKIIVS
jgi:hypothetical protein